MGNSHPNQWVTLSITLLLFHFLYDNALLSHWLGWVYHECFIFSTINMIYMCLYGLIYQIRMGFLLLYILMLLYILSSYSFSLLLLIFLLYTVLISIYTCWLCLYVGNCFLQGQLNIPFLPKCWLTSVSVENGALSC